VRGARMDPEQMWREKPDEEVLAAAGNLADYTDEGERIIRAELRRRGLPEPARPIGSCLRCGRSIAANHPGHNCLQCGEQLRQETLQLVYDRTRGVRLSPRTVVVISGIVVWPVWFGILVLVGIFVEEVLGWKQAFDGPDWIPRTVAIVLFGAGFFLWRIAAAVVDSRWGPSSETTGSRRTTTV